jgi:hypothetical protein
MEAKTWPPAGGMCIGDSLVEVLRQMPDQMRLNDGAGTLSVGEAIVRATEVRTSLSDDPSAFYRADVSDGRAVISRVLGNSRTAIYTQADDES